MMKQLLIGIIIASTMILIGQAENHSVDNVFNSDTYNLVADPEVPGPGGR